MKKIVRIGTRESELAVWQASTVKHLLEKQDIDAQLVFVKSEGDIDLVTPLYEMGVQGIFTKTLDAALLNNRIDIAVHSMKDVPTVLPKGIEQAAILKRATYKDLLVFKRNEIVELWKLEEAVDTPIMLDGIIATSSIRRKAQWLHRYPNHRIENLRGNVNTRMFKVSDSHWDGAIFAAAGLERIDLRPKNSVDLNWMLPAPAQGAIMVVCRKEDEWIQKVCEVINHSETAQCTTIERAFLHELKGGCSTPISALAVCNEGQISFKGNICSVDGKDIVEVRKEISLKSPSISSFGKDLASEILENEKAWMIMQDIKNAK